MLERVERRAIKIIPTSFEMCLRVNNRRMRRYQVEMSKRLNGYTNIGRNMFHDR